MKIETGTWVLIADGEKYLLLRNTGDAELLDLRVLDHVEQENAQTRDQGTDRPGRFDNPAGPGRSAVAETDWNRLGKERFTKELAERLRLGALRDEFRALVIVADPRTLGVLRPALHKAVLERVTGELDKDLTGAPVDELEAALKAA
jgi:protein required for attachment to host cells